MSLLQEMHEHGLADCEFNRQFFNRGSGMNPIKDCYMLKIKSILYAQTLREAEKRRRERADFLKFLRGSGLG
jgi:hypothetical protein